LNTNIKVFIEELNAGNAVSKSPDTDTEKIESMQRSNANAIHFKSRQLQSGQLRKVENSRFILRFGTASPFKQFQKVEAREANKVGELEANKQGGKKANEGCDTNRLNVTNWLKPKSTREIGP
jgi:hypothetical protein